MTETMSVGNSEQTRRSAAALQPTESEVAPTANGFIQSFRMCEKRKWEAQNAESTNKSRETISLDMKLDVLRENDSETNVNELASKLKLLHSAVNTAVMA